MDKFEIGQSKELSFGTKVSSLYNNSDLTRALVMLLPAGGIIDLFACKPAQQFAQDKINLLIEELLLRLDKIEKVTLSSDDENMFFHLVFKVCQNVITARTNEKITHLASVLSHSIEQIKDWDEAESVVNLVNALTDTHIHILRTITNMPPCSAPNFEGLRVVKLVEGNYIDAIYNLKDAVPSVSEHALKMYCSDLVAKGLLLDEGIGRYNGKTLEIIRATNTSDWFLKWLSKKVA